MMDRLLNEPVLVVAAILAVMNLIGVDAETQDLAAKAIESTLLLVGAVIARAKVTPTRKRDV